jgi:hypothetical protein
MNADLVLLLAWRAEGLRRRALVIVIVP